MMTDTRYKINCYNEDTRELQHFSVSKSIYTYIRQLECAIKYDSPAIKNKYPNRFQYPKENNDDE